MYQKYNHKPMYVAISNANRDRSLDYLATIHHGIAVDDFELHPSRGGYLLFFGRIHPDKGTSREIDLARRGGRRLIIVGIIQDQQYFERDVEPFIDGDQIRFVGPVNAAGRCALLGGADALVHLISFEGPFGFSIAEAMACGTPVIATRRGSMPELIEDGVVGFLIVDLSEGESAVERCRDLDRRAIRGVAIDRLDARRMVAEYLALYERVLAGARFAKRS